MNPDITGLDGDELFYLSPEAFLDKGKSFRNRLLNGVHALNDLTLFFYLPPEQVETIPYGFWYTFPLYSDDYFKGYASLDKRIVASTCIATVPHSRNSSETIEDAIKAIAQAYEAKLNALKYEGNLPSSDDPEAFIAAISKDKKALKLLKRTFAEVVPYNPFAEPEFEYDLLAQYYKQTGKPAVVPTGEKVIRCNYHAGLHFTGYPFGDNSCAVKLEWVDDDKTKQLGEDDRKDGYDVPIDLSDLSGLGLLRLTYVGAPVVYANGTVSDMNRWADEIFEVPVLIRDEPEPTTASAESEPQAFEGTFRQIGDATYFKPEPEQPDEEKVAMVEVVK
jgi:hypothetical protein